jgi:DHA1 family bicyclomycin/chloramphenicol resistance-like MFS transporter
MVLGGSLVQIDIFQNRAKMKNTFQGLDHASGSSAVTADIGTDTVAEQHPRQLLAILSLLMAFASISTDLYLPAMPTMAHALRSNYGTMEYTISGYLVGFSLGQLFWGPMADHYGRRAPLTVGLLMFVTGSAGCALSTGISMMITFRVFQALGACAGVVLARAMVRDLYDGERSARMLSMLMTVMAIAPLLGPVV